MPYDPLFKFHLVPKKLLNPTLPINGSPLENKNTQMQPSANMEKTAQKIKTQRMRTSLVFMKKSLLKIIHHDYSKIWREKI